MKHWEKIVFGLWLYMLAVVVAMFTGTCKGLLETLFRVGDWPFGEGTYLPLFFGLFPVLQIAMLFVAYKTGKIVFLLSGCIAFYLLMIWCLFAAFIVLWSFSGPNSLWI